jgi:hypothetical protein
MELKTAETKKGKQHLANYNKEDGGLQHTPGFLHSICIKILSSSTLNGIANVLVSSNNNDNERNNDHCPSKMKPECSGFTNVGKHTGCNQHEMIIPIVLAVMKITFQKGMYPPLCNDMSHECYSQFLIEWYLIGLKNVSNFVIMTGNNTVTNHDINAMIDDLNQIAQYIQTSMRWDILWPNFFNLNRTGLLDYTKLFRTNYRYECARSMCKE